jgi:hypothetical protein
VGSFDVENSQNIYFSIGIKNKNYIFLNEDYSKRVSEFEKLVAKLKDYNFYLRCKRKFEKLLSNYKADNIKKFLTKQVKKSMFV